MSDNLSACDNIGGSRGSCTRDGQIGVANNGHMANTNSRSGALQVPEVSTGTVTDTSSGMDGTMGIDSIKRANLSRGATPRWDQHPLIPSTSGDGLTLTHKTTEHTESIYETVYEYDEDGVAVPTHQKKKRKMDNSVYSYNSSRDVSQFVKESHGRTFNKLVDAYLLPSDESEWTRLDKQHIAHVLATGGLSPCHDLVDAVLVPEEGVEKKVLDLGCGTGVWAIEMARKYSHTHVTGVDVAPVPFDTSILPVNLDFEIYDINEGLDHFYGQFEVVHMRSVQAGLRDFDRTMREVQLCTKPGGVVVIIDGDVDICDEDRLHAVKIPDVAKEGPDSPGSWFRRIIWEVDLANQLAGATPRRAGQLIDLGLWSHPLCDPDTAASGEYFLPIGSWPKAPDIALTQRLGYTGSLMRQGILNIHRAFHPILLRYGMNQQILDEWSRKIDEEIGETKLKLWIRFRFTYARRRAAPDQPAPPLPSPILAAASTEPQALQSNQAPQSSQFDGSLESLPAANYPYITYFKTPEEAARNADQRREAKPSEPESECQRAWSLKKMEERPQVTTEQATE